MKKLIIAIALLFPSCFLFGQNKAIEDEIKMLEQLEVKAILAKDTVTLKKLWDKDFVLNNPTNQIVLAKDNSVDRPVLNQPRTSFTREVEYLTVRGDVVISMGNETVVPAGDMPSAGKLVKRRYTHTWMKLDGTWKLAARHANVICQ